MFTIIHTSLLKWHNSLITVEHDFAVETRGCMEPKTLTTPSISPEVCWKNWAKTFFFVEVHKLFLQDVAVKFQHWLRLQTVSICNYLLFLNYFCCPWCEFSIFLVSFNCDTLENRGETSSRIHTSTSRHWERSRSVVGLAQQCAPSFCNRSARVRNFWVFFRQKFFFLLARTF